MAKNIIGLDISDSSIEALALEKHRGNFTVEAYSRFRLSPEIVSNGRILDKEKLKEAILKMFKNAKPLAFDKSRKVFLSIPESQTFSRVLSIPKNVRDKDIEAATINQAEELIPETINRLTAIIRVLPEKNDQKQVFYVAAETEALQEFVDVFKELGIELAGITTETISSFNGLKKDKDKKNTLLLDLGASTTIASVFSEEGLCSSININIGGNNITEAIAKKLNITHSKAEQKKVKNGLTSTESGEIMLISQGQLQPLVDELKVFMNYWQTATSRNIEQVVLIGGLSQMKGADKYFGDNLNLPVRIGEPFIDKSSLPAKLEFAKYINVLGLARLAYQNGEVDFYRKLPKDVLKKTGNLQPGAAVVKENIFKKIWHFINPVNLGLVFKNKYFLIVLGGLILGTGVFIFRDRLWPESPPLSVGETIIVSNDETKRTENFVLGEYFDFRGSKIYNASADTTLPEDYLDNFSNTLDRLEVESNVKVLEIINDYGPEGFYILPQIITYETLSTEPIEDDYAPGQELKANLNYTFMMFPEEEIRKFLLDKYPELTNKINTLDYNILEYTHNETSDDFKVSVVVNKKS